MALRVSPPSQPTRSRHACRGRGRHGARSPDWYVRGQTASVSRSPMLVGTYARERENGPKGWFDLDEAVASRPPELPRDLCPETAPLLAPEERLAQSS